MGFCWLVTLLGACAGGISIITTALMATSAPQQAAGYACACALAVVPYVFTRAAHMLKTESGAEETTRIVAAVDRLAASVSEFRTEVSNTTKTQN